MSMPADIIFATDLSHRCDRALERVLQLARRWQARLRIVHVLPPTRSGPADAPDWYRPPDAAQAARARIYADIASRDARIDFGVHTASTAEGPPADAVLELAEGAGLIVIGIDSSGGWPRLPGGRTSEQIMRRAQVPVLVVRDRVDGDYADVLFTSDFSPASQAALTVAHGWFPDARLTLFHAYDVPYGLLLDRDRIAEQFAADRLQQAQQFLHAALPAEAADAVRCIVAYGAADGLLRDYHAEFAHHLTVIGGRDGGRVQAALIGSTGRRIAEAVPGDVLFVPAAVAQKPQVP